MNREKYKPKNMRASSEITTGHPSEMQLHESNTLHCSCHSAFISIPQQNRDMTKAQKGIQPSPIAALQ